MTLVQSYLTNIPLFTMSQYPIPVGIRKKADFIGQGLCGKLTWIKRNTIWLIGNLFYAKTTRGFGDFKSGSDEQGTISQMVLEIGN